MKKNLSLLIAFCLTLSCSEAEIFDPLEEMGEVVEILETSSPSDIFMVVDESPTFPGGNAKWQQFLKSNLKYPNQAIREGVQGAVYLSFVLDKEGHIDDVVVSRGIGAGCDEEAVKILLTSPNWNPAKVNGETVKARMAIRIVFKNGETKAIQDNITEKDFAEVEEKVYVSGLTATATYPGGATAWNKYLKSNIELPKQAIEKGIEGAVYLSFEVSDSGEISDVLVARGIGAGCDEEAVRLLKKSTDWTPARINTEAVKSRQAIRIIFKQPTKS
ncbi:MAG: TonB family protein [Roseivirga sp.]|jgi:TonB family protein